MRGISGGRELVEGKSKKKKKKKPATLILSFIYFL